MTRYGGGGVWRARLGGGCCRCCGEEGMVVSVLLWLRGRCAIGQQRDTWDNRTGEREREEREEETGSRQSYSGRVFCPWLGSFDRSEATSSPTSHK